MKYIYSKLLVIVVGTLFLFSSCSLDKDPYNYFTKEELEKQKETSFKYLINGCYSQLKAWSDEMHRIGEYPADNIMIRGVSTDNFFPFISYEHIKDNGRLYTFWENSYRAIIQSTDAIKLMEEGKSEEFDYNLGEAYYIRGMVYFYLTRVFGRPYYDSPERNLGVPIVLKGSPSNIEEIYAPDRSSVKDCYEQAIKDLKEGERLMKSATNVKKSSAYASAEAAQAMLSRIYLYMSGTFAQTNTEYADQSIFYSNAVLNSNRYQLLPTENFRKYNEYAPDNAVQTETIFAIKRVSAEFKGDDHFYGIGGMYANILGKGWGEMYATSKYMDLLKEAGYHKEDARWAFIDPQYQRDKVTKKPIEGFRFIANLYNADKVQTGYGYIQDTLRVKADGSYYIKISVPTVADPKKTERKDFPLTAVDVANGLYSINYNGITYTGEKDYVMLTNNGHPMFYVTKCSLQEGESHLHSPIISRLAEIYLNLAEAYAKKGDYGAALTNLNVIRERSVPGQAYSALNANNAEQTIEKERQLELAYEAHRAYDVYRNAGTMKRHYPGAHNAMVDILPTSLRVVHYIPQKEINAYPGTLTQNP